MELQVLDQQEQDLLQEDFHLELEVLDHHHQLRQQLRRRKKLKMMRISLLWWR